jgi:hypothetical protein
MNFPRPDNQVANSLELQLFRNHSMTALRLRDKPVVVHIAQFELQMHTH